MQSFDAAMSQVFGKDWKSTFGAYLTIFFTVGGFVTTYLAVIPNPRPWVVVVTGGLTSAVGLAKLVVGHLTIDAGTVLAKVPNAAEPQVVPSTEVPLNPKDKVVKEKS